MMIRVFRGAFAVDKDRVGMLQRHALVNGAHVFNPDKCRLQADIPSSHEAVAPIESVLCEHGVLRGRHIGGVVVLHSKKGCQRQDWHLDYDPCSVRSLRSKSPVGVIAAFENHTHFVTPDTTYELNAGDILCFDASTVHAGAAYPLASNTRIHMYLDVDRVATRNKNTTWLVGMELM